MEIGNVSMHREPCELYSVSLDRELSSRSLVAAAAACHRSLEEASPLPTVTRTRTRASYARRSLPASDADSLWPSLSLSLSQRERNQKGLKWRKLRLKKNAF